MRTEISIKIKGKSRESVDGAVACAMAVARASAGDSGRSIYDQDDMAGGLTVL
jgi:ADP-ribosylglycohydrolase